MASLDDVVKGGIDLLPAVGQKVEFDVFKGQLYAAYPDGGRDAFARMIKNELINKELARNADGKLVVMLSRKS